MQWLIDIITEAVIAAIGIPPVYVNRGEHDASDFSLGDFTVDGAEHDIDMSAFIPAEASAVNLHIVGRSNVITDVFFLRPKSIPDIFGSCTIRIQVAGHLYCVRRTWACDADRIFTYSFTGTDWTVLKINIKGWWL